jgi:hypothetical protein
MKKGENMKLIEASVSPHKGGYPEPQSGIVQVTESAYPKGNPMKSDIPERIAVRERSALVVPGRFCTAVSVPRIDNRKKLL